MFSGNSWSVHPFDYAVQLEKLAELQQKDELQLKEQQHDTEIAQLQASLQEANDRSGKIRLQYERYWDHIASALHASQILLGPHSTVVLTSSDCLDSAHLDDFSSLASWLVLYIHELVRCLQSTSHLASQSRQAGKETGRGEGQSG